MLFSHLVTPQVFEGIDCWFICTNSNQGFVQETIFDIILYSAAYYIINKNCIILKYMMRGTYSVQTKENFISANIAH